MSDSRPWETGDERARWEGYLDPNTGILRNLVGARTWEDLRVIEDDLVEARAHQLLERPIEGTYDLAHIQAIHHQLFQDVYPWAGENRTVNIAKGQPFAQHENIVPFTQHLAAEISRANRLHGTSSEQFAHQLANFYNQLNDIHPFREGNGRTQRTFWDQLAADAQKDIDWQKVHGRENDLASMEGRAGNLAPLHSMFQKIVTDKQAAETSSRPQTMAERQTQILAQAKIAGMLSGTGPLTARDRKTLEQSSIKPLTREQLHERRAERDKETRSGDSASRSDYRAQGQERGD